MFDLAIERVRQFQEQHGASESECCSVLGIRPDRFRDFMDRHDIAGIYAENVVLMTGADQIDGTLEALRKLRGEESMADMTKRLVREFKIAAGLNTNAQIAAMLRETGHVDMSDKQFGVWVSPATRIGEERCESILKALACMDWPGRPFPADLEPYRTPGGQSEPCSPAGNEQQTDAPEQEAVSKASFPPNPDPDPEPTLEDRTPIDQARDLLEDAFGMTFDELLAMKPQIELIAVCRRNGIPCDVQASSRVHA